MPLISYPEFVRLREGNAPDLAQYTIAMQYVGEEEEAPQGGQIIVPGSKVQKWFGMGYRPVGYEEGERLRRLLEKAHGGSGRAATEPAPRNEMERLSTLSMTTLRKMARERGYRPTVALSKSDLVRLLVGDVGEETEDVHGDTEV